MMNKPPLVSIGLPVFNGENYLAEAIDSILAQTFTDFELIISDNSSTDRTQEICEAYANVTPSIRYLRCDENRGAAWNYNTLFNSSRGKYFKWAAHDDVIKPTFLEKCVERLENDPQVGLCYARSALIDGESLFIRNVHDGFERPQEKPHQRVQTFAPGLCHPVFGLIRSAVLEKTDLIGAYPDSDKTLLWQLLLAGKVAEVDEVLFLRRTHADTSVRANLDYKSRMRWFDPTRRRLLYLPTWQHFLKRTWSVLKAEISIFEKWRCFQPLARTYLLHPGWMIKDIPLAIRDALGVSPLMKNKDWI